MGYDLNGKRLILSVNVIKFDDLSKDRNGSEVDETNILNTFMVSTPKIELRSRNHPSSARVTVMSVTSLCW